MTKYTGKFVKLVTVTGCSVILLSLSSLSAALADEPRNGAPPAAAAPAVTAHPPTDPATAPTTAPATAPTTAPVGAPSVAVPAEAPRCATLDRHRTFVQFIEAVTDKTVPQEIQDLLQGVVSLERKGNDIELTKEDGSKVMAGGETHFGATVIGDFSEARDKVALKFGPEVGALIDEFVGVKASGSHLEVIRTGPEIEDIDLSEKKINRQLPLRRVRLSKISLDVDVADSHPVLRNITGIEAVPNTALEIPIVLREFSRCKNSDGDDVFTFGVKNPIPFVKPFKKLLGIKEIIPLTWTVKRPDAANKEIGVKVPAEQLGERIGAETLKQAGEKTGAPTLDQQLDIKTGAPTLDQQLDIKTGAPTLDQQLDIKTGAPTLDQRLDIKTGAPTLDQQLDTKTGAPTQDQQLDTKTGAPTLDQQLDTTTSAPTIE